MSLTAIFWQGVLVLANLLAMSTLASPRTAAWFGVVIAALTLLGAFVAVGLASTRPRWQVAVVVCVACAFVLSPLAVADTPHGWVVKVTWAGGIAASDEETVLAILIGSTVAFSALFLSSLVDFAWVLPQMSGSTGSRAQMPCQSSLDPRWKGVTGNWLFHRLLAVLSFVLGLTVVVTLSTKQWIQNIDQTTAAALAAAATLLAGFYLTRARAVMAYTRNPALWVGDQVSLIDEGTNNVRSYYVMDVALEGVKLLDLEKLPTERVRDDRGWLTHDRMLDLPDAPKLLRTRTRFPPCGDGPDGCKRVNPYCKWRTELEGADRPSRRRRRPWVHARALGRRLLGLARRP
jgi:hypothetical protein